MPQPPNPASRYPLAGESSVIFLKNVVDNPQIEIGDYTYYHDFDDPAGFERNVRYLFPFIGDRLVIGKFCAIASGATFLMNGGSHATEGFSTYPFSIFGGAWAAAEPEHWPQKGDTVIGNDVWIGYQATFLPGVTVGDGAIIAAKAVVTGDVPPYAVMAGNPARVVRLRFPEATIDRLLKLRWWNWPVERITAQLSEITGGDIAALEAAAAK
jgi:virginiamycin A acetyltransferase